MCVSVCVSSSEACSDYDSGAESGEEAMTEERYERLLADPACEQQGPIYGKRATTLTIFRTPRFID